MTTWSIIHELGHACGAARTPPQFHHNRTSREGLAPEVLGAVNCPMRYFRVKDKIDILLHGRGAECFRGTKFCRDTDHCWSCLSLQNP